MSFLHGMLKPIARLLLAAAFVLVSGRCSSSGEEETTAAFSAAFRQTGTAELDAKGYANDPTVVLTGKPGTSYTVTVTEGGTWCWTSRRTQATTRSGSLATRSDIIYLYLADNETGSSRHAELTVTFAGGETFPLTIEQQDYDIPEQLDHAWAELPAFRAGSDLVYKNYYTSITAGQTVRNYSICYDKQKHISHWVAYPIHQMYTSYKNYKTKKGNGRTDAWAYDDSQTAYADNSKGYDILGRSVTQPEIAEEDQQYIISSYRAGYDRGHMLSSASRFRTWMTNAQTFYATNMMPQNGTLNQKIWATLESTIRSMGGSRYDTLYVVTGTHFANSRTINNANGPIAVPSHCWKIVLRQRGNENRQITEFSADELKSIGFLFTNDAEGAGLSLKEAACSVRDIEELTGFSFYKMLDPAVADVVKAQNNPADWGIN